MTDVARRKSGRYSIFLQSNQQALERLNPKPGGRLGISGCLVWLLALRSCCCLYHKQSQVDSLADETIEQQETLEEGGGSSKNIKELGESEESPLFVDMRPRKHSSSCDRKDGPTPQKKKAYFLSPCRKMSGGGWRQVSLCSIGTWSKAYSSARYGISAAAGAGEWRQLGLLYCGST